MKRILFALPFMISVTYAQTKKPAVPAKAAAKIILSSTDSLSYAMGIQTAQYYKSQGADKINPNMVKKAYEGRI